MGIAFRYPPFARNGVRDAIVNAAVGDIWRRIMHIDQVGVSKESTGLHHSSLVGEIPPGNIQSGTRRRDDGIARRD